MHPYEANDREVTDSGYHFLPVSKIVSGLSERSDSPKDLRNEFLWTLNYGFQVIYTVPAIIQQCKIPKPLKSKAKQSHYTPRWRLGGEEA
jgi:hypothetical protein